MGLTACCNFCSWLLIERSKFDGAHTRRIWRCTVCNRLLESVSRDPASDFTSRPPNPDAFPFPI